MNRVNYLHLTNPDDLNNCIMVDLEDKFVYIGVGKDLSCNWFKLTPTEAQNLADLIILGIGDY